MFSIKAGAYPSDAPFRYFTVYRQIDRLTDRPADNGTDEQIDRWTEGLLDGQTIEWTSRHMNKWRDRLISLAVSVHSIFYQV
jgi:hypothetical protein